MTSKKNPLYKSPEDREQEDKVRLLARVQKLVRGSKPSTIATALGMVLWSQLAASSKSDAEYDQKMSALLALLEDEGNAFKKGAIERGLIEWSTDDEA